MKKAQPKEESPEDVAHEPIQPKYTVWLKFNDEEHLIQTDDVRSAILSVKPEFLFTELYLTIASADMRLEREFTLVMGKRLFNNEDNLDMFVANLLF